MSYTGNRNQNLGCHVPSKAFGGYTLYSFMGECGAWLIDMSGRFVHNWEAPFLPGRYGKLLENGNLLYGAKNYDPAIILGGISGKIIELDWEGNIVWQYEDPYLHHDFSRLPNGNTMVLKYVQTPPEIASRVSGGIPGSEKEGIMWSDAFQEVTPDGEVVWEWLAHEHLEPDDYSICPLDARAEWLHCNTCCVLPGGDILTSFLRQNKIGIIDKKTGKVRWQWGEGENLGHPHDPGILDSGNILVFDNGTHRRDDEEAGYAYGMVNYSRILEVNPENNEIVWEYRDPWHLNFSAPFISGCQRLPNGNTLICAGPTGRLFEVTPEKEIVWEFINPFFNSKLDKLIGYSNAVFRAYRYAPEHPAFSGKNLDPERVEMTLRVSPVWEHENKAARDKVLNDRIRQLGY